MNSISMASSPIQQNQNRPPPPQSGEDLVKKLDADGSGGLSVAEIEETKFGQRIGDSFGDIDTDGDGNLSVAELDAGALAAREAGGPGGGQNGGPPPGGTPSGVDAEALFQSLFEGLSEDDNVSADLTAYVQQLYADGQVLFGVS